MEKKALKLILLSVCIFLLCCKKDNPLKPPIDTGFISATLTMQEGDAPKDIIVSLLSPAEVDENIMISLVDSTTQYGKEYYTLPDGGAGSISLTILKGTTSASFSISTIKTSASDGDKIVNFTITNVSKKLKVKTGKVKVSIIDMDLICYLPFNGNAIDFSHYAQSTSINGASLTSGKNGSPSTAYLFDGIQNDISIKNSSTLDQLQNLTLTAWIRPVSFYGRGNNSIIEKPYSSHVNPYYQYSLGITGDQYPNIPASFLFSLSLNGSYTVLTSNSNTWAPGNWYFVAGTYDGSKMTLYVNGVKVASQTANGVVGQFGKDISVGNIPNVNSFTPGAMDEIRIYNRALSNAEIQSLYTRIF